MMARGMLLMVGVGGIVGSATMVDPRLGLAAAGLLALLAVVDLSR